MDKTALVCAMAFLAAACASQPGTGSMANANSKNADCYSYMETGSNVPKKRCLTKEEQAALEQQNSQNVQALQEGLRMHPNEMDGSGGAAGGPPG